MKKTVTLIFSFLAVLYSFGQQNQATLADEVQKEQNRPNAKPMTANDRATPFWTEDFGNGFPAGWQVYDTSGICPWVWSDDGSWGNFNGNGATAAAAGISSTTAGNGFLICDVDSANHFTYGQPSGTTYQYLPTWVQTGAIDCSGHSSVILNFEQFYRYNNGVPMYVGVSNDGTNWEFHDVSAGLANNTASANPAMATVNISGVAANQPTVYLRFGWSARVYYWMIDDITLSEADAYDLGMVDSWWGMNTFDYQYYKIPLTHATPITFYSAITNNTGAQITGCSATVDVSGGAFSGVTATADIDPAATDTVASTTTWTPTVTGDYDITYVAETSAGTDANPSNNTHLDSVQITSTIFGLDNLRNPSQTTGSISNFSSNTGGQFKIGNLYQVTIDDNVECIEVGISSDANNVGKTIFGEVYTYDTNLQEFVYVSTTDNYDIVAGDPGTIINLPLLQAAQVTAGSEILVVAGHYGGDPGGNDDVGFMYGQPVVDRMVWGYDAQGDLFWLSSPRAIVVRANFFCGLGVDENENEVNISAYPNPFNEQLTVEVDQYTSGTVALLDITGKEVLTSNIAGNDVTLNTAKLASGMYTVVIQTEDSTVKKKVQLVR